MLDLNSPMESLGSFEGKSFEAMEWCFVLYYKKDLERLMMVNWIVVLLDFYCVWGD